MIDQEDLKKSHIPIFARPEFFAHAKTCRAINSSHIKESAMKHEYNLVRDGSKVSKIPFSPTKRNRVEKKYEKFDKINGYGQSIAKSSYKWQIPTYDLNP